MSAYINYDDLARLEYGRILWRNPRDQQQLINHWTDLRHSYRERFLQNRALVERLLNSRPEDDSILENELIRQDTSLRAAMREIPPVFGSFWQCAIVRD
jgi:hypothetical protein